MICQDVMTCLRKENCSHARIHNEKSDCKIIFDHCPICVDDGIFLYLEDFIEEEEMVL